MLVARLGHSIRRQDWFAVVVELLIVVVGVYLGIYIGEAEDDRALGRDVDLSLQSLRDELQADLVNIDEIIQIHLDGRETYQKAIELLSQSPVDTEAFAALQTPLVLINVSFFPSMSAYETIRQLGYLAEIRDVALRQQIANLYERIYVRQTVRAGLMDEVGTDFQLRKRDEYWQRIEKHFLGDPADAAGHLQNAINTIRLHSASYRYYLETAVRPELVAAIDALNQYLKPTPD